MSKRRPAERPSAVAHEEVASVAPRTLWLALCGVALLAVLLVVQEPRLHHSFPSLVDDWYAIERTPSQIGEALTLGLPEGGRYRPGWIVWNQLQWHTLGGPDALWPARAWGALRAILLPGGLVVALLVSTWGSGSAARRSGWTAVLAVTIAGAVVTVPGFARDLARYGPQEPLLVGLASLGAGLVALAARRTLEGRARPAILPALVGVLVWAAGVTQKESAICLLVLVPFLVLELRTQRARVATLPRSHHLLLLGLAAGVLAPVIPMLVRTIQLRDDDLVYGASPGEDVVERAVTSVRLTSATVGSPLVGVLVVIAVLMIVARLWATRRFEWLAPGFLVTAAAFLVFASQAGVVVSRYYLPVATLAGLAVCRSVVGLSRAAVIGTAATMALLVLAQMPSARTEVESWVAGERDQEALVRWTAGARAAGCTVAVTGGDVELVTGLPVLLRYGGDPVDCDPTTRYVAVLTGTAGEADSDPALDACAPAATPVLSTSVGRVVRCTSG